MTLTRTKKIITAALAIVTLGLGSIALAQPDHHRGPGGRGGFGRGFGPGGGGFPALRQLDLTDAQREQVRGILDQNREQFRALHEKLAAARKAQHEAIQAVPANEQQIRSLTSELAAVEADAAVLRSQVHTAIFNLLTPEQQAKAKELKAQRQQRMSERRERAQERRQQRQQQRQQGQPQTPPPAGQL